MRHSVSLAALAAALAFCGAATHAADTPTAGGNVLTGTAAFGSWEDARPGVTRLIKPSDLPPPYATKSSSNAPAPADMPPGGMPNVLPGFHVAEFASGMQQPRVIEIAPNGDVFVADSGAGEIDVFRMGDGGAVARKDVFATGLDRPYGIAFYPKDDPQYVYVANTGSVVRYPYKSGDMVASGGSETVIPELPVGYHWTRDLAFSLDGKTLFVSVGSGSNVGDGTMDVPAPPPFIANHPLGTAWAEENNRADVLAFDPDGKNERIYATGLRNCSGMTIQPATGELWCVVNERDALGDNLVPDYSTRVRPGGFYGWPWYYMGDHEDPRHAGERPDLAGKTMTPDVPYQAHSAAVGLTFYTASTGRSAFPDEYVGDGFAVFHGSWNRSSRTGHKIVRVPMKNGAPTGEYVDFLVGFITADGKPWARPASVTEASDGSLLMSDDDGDVIYRISYSR